MNYWKISDFDVANGVGVRVAVFVSGCSGMPCADYCFNKAIQSFAAGSPWGREQVEHVLNALDNEYTDGITLLGGEPFLNFRGLSPLIDAVHDKFGGAKTVWAFSGFVIDDILPVRSRREMLERCDVLVDGPFVPSLKDDRLRFRGSANQRILDVGESVRTLAPVWAESMETEHELSRKILREHGMNPDISIDAPVGSSERRTRKARGLISSGV